MKKLTILVDMDDTITHLLEAWVTHLNERHGTSVKVDSIREWDIHKAFPMLTGDDVYAPLTEDGFWKEVRPMSGAREILLWAKEQGHKVYIVTASAYQTLPEKMENVLFKYFPFISWDDVIVTSNKQMIRGDILFDDAPHNLEGGHFVKILMDAPHNQSYDAEAHGMYRMRYWHEAMNVIRAVSHQDDIKNWRERPTEFMQNVLGLKPLLYQKLIIEYMAGEN